MSAHELAVEIVRRMPELQRDGHLNQVLTVEALLKPWQDEIVEQTTQATLRMVAEHYGH